MSRFSSNMNRRDFLRNSSAAALGAMSLAAGPLATAGFARPPKKRLALVGAGMRGGATWGEALLRDFGDHVEMTGLCDINKKRVEVVNRWLGGKIPTFTEFDRMIAQIKPESVIVTTVDGTHWQYVTRAMELGCDVLSEKPLCTEAEQAQAIIDVQKRTGRRLDVTFNARHGQEAMKLKELLLNKEIGEIYSVYYDEFLDLDHGASYFRRWHGHKENSGTLLCHKASHHFDQLNWWIDAEPVEVVAYGELKKYGANGELRHANCRLCPYRRQCELYWDIATEPRAVELYAECESEDGYFRDGCLFRRSIDIYDTMSVQIQYANKVQVTYTLNATVPYEGQLIVFNGSKGRIELRNFNKQPWDVKEGSELRLTRNSGQTMLIPIARQKVDVFEHGGADYRIKAMLFQPGFKDELGQHADLRAGIMSSLIGIAGYTSIERRERIRVQDLVSWA